MKKRIKLTESDLHNIIKESVKNILTELDWRTYANAMKKAEDDKRPFLAKNLWKKIHRLQSDEYDGTSIANGYIPDWNDSPDVKYITKDGRTKYGYVAHDMELDDEGNFVNNGQKLYNRNGKCIGNANDYETTPVDRKKQQKGLQDIKDFKQGKMMYKNGKWIKK